MKSMKRFILCLAMAVMFTACLEEPYVMDREHNGRIKYFVSDFCDMKEICWDDTHKIFWDKKTDVLYFAYSTGYRMGITPIMKPDGSCLTLSEWEKEHIK